MSSRICRERENFDTYVQKIYWKSLSFSVRRLEKLCVNNNCITHRVEQKKFIRLSINGGKKRRSPWAAIEVDKNVNCLFHSGWWSAGYPVAAQEFYQLTSHRSQMSRDKSFNCRKNDWNDVGDGPKSAETGKNIWNCVGDGEEPASLHPHDTQGVETVLAKTSTAFELVQLDPDDLELRSK